jgi:hypothetical protein
MSRRKGARKAAAYIMSHSSAAVPAPTQEPASGRRYSRRLAQYAATVRGLRPGFFMTRTDKSPRHQEPVVATPPVSDAAYRW